MSGLRDRYGPCALILGASEGIGAAFAEQLAAYGVDVCTATVDLKADDMEQRLIDATSDTENGFVVYNAGATHVAGDTNRGVFDHLRSMPRADVVSMMSQSVLTLYGLES